MLGQRGPPSKYSHPQAAQNFFSFLDDEHRHRDEIIGSIRWLTRPYHATCWRLFNKTQSFSRRRRRPGGEMESWLFISVGLHKDKRCSRVQSRPRQNCFCNAGTLVLHGIGLIGPSLYIIMSGSGRPSAKVPVTKVYMSFRSKK